MSGVRVKQLAVGGWLVFERTIRALGIIHLLSLLLFIITIIIILFMERSSEMEFIDYHAIYTCRFGHSGGRYVASLTFS